IAVNHVLDRVVSFTVGGNAPSNLPTPTKARPTAPPSSPTLAPSSGRPPIPAGQGGLAVVSHYGREINFTINNKLYKVPPNGTEFIFLPPGKYNSSANIPGIGSANNTVEIQLGGWFTQTFTE
ncbi:MAG TPA: hypothetical protein VF932_03960, partial [Anaerolineae bacterium]